MPTLTQTLAWQTLIKHQQQLAGGQLRNLFANYAATSRAAIDNAAEHGDQDTSDLFTEISRAIDKQLWFLEAHLQASKE